MAGRRHPGGELGRLTGASYGPLAELLATEPRPGVRTPELEQSNTVLFVGERALVKVYREIEPNINPELEVGLYLSRHGDGRLAPGILASLGYEQPGRAPAPVALIQDFVANEGDAWNLTLSEIELFLDRVLSQQAASPPAPDAPPLRFTEAARATPPIPMQELCGRYFSLARQLAKRTAEVHLLLASDPSDPAFAPEPFTTQHQQSIFQWSHARLARTFEALRRRLPALPARTRELAASLLPEEKDIDDRLRLVTKRKIEVSRIRCHGDLHLGQVLFKGDDFVIIDFEGEPARPASERRYKRCALRDAMGMVRSFGYAAEAVLRGARVRSEDLPTVVPWTEAWTQWVSAAYLGAYLQAHRGQPPRPRQRRVPGSPPRFLRAREGDLRDRIRAPQPPRLAPHPPPGLEQHARAEEDLRRPGCDSPREATAPSCTSLAPVCGGEGRGEGDAGECRPACRYPRVASRDSRHVSATALPRSGRPLEGRDGGRRRFRPERGAGTALV